MNKAFFILGLLLSIGLSIFAQPYTYDSSFQPYFDIRTNSPNAGLINGVWENPKNGKLFVVGDFDIGGGVPFHGNFTQTNRYGNYVSNFSASLMGGNSRSSVYPINDTLYALIASGLYLQTDTFGSILFNNFYNNYWRTVSCKTGYSPFFFKDGSALIPNGLGNPGSCQIYSYNDTFPHQYIVKVTNQGLYDSTFKVYPNKEPSGFVPYDSNRILVFGKPYLFTHYNGKRIN
ncbi:MAG: hypothetical protein KDB74_06655, partial [Flavobacteriales bacterium]|nr:hypothetical protein [Flavobacteriales bacterium]